MTLMIPPLSKKKRSSLPHSLPCLSSNPNVYSCLQVRDDLLKAARLIYFQSYHTFFYVNFFHSILLCIDIGDNEQSSLQFPTYTISCSVHLQAGHEEGGRESDCVLPACTCCAPLAILWRSPGTSPSPQQLHPIINTYTTNILFILFSVAHHM